MEAGLDLFRVAEPAWFELEPRESTMSRFLSGPEIKLPAFFDETIRLEGTIKRVTLAAEDRKCLHGWSYRDVPEYKEVFELFYGQVSDAHARSKRFKPLPEFEAWGEQNASTLSLRHRAISMGPPAIVLIYNLMHIIRLMTQ